MNTRTMTQGSGSAYEPSHAGHFSTGGKPLNLAEVSRNAGLKTKIKILKGKWLLERSQYETNMLRAFKETKHGLTAEEFAEKW